MNSPCMHCVNNRNAQNYESLNISNLLDSLKTHVTKIETFTDARILCSVISSIKHLLFVTIKKTRYYYYLNIIMLSFRYFQCYIVGHVQNRNFSIIFLYNFILIALLWQISQISLWPHHELVLFFFLSADVFKEFFTRSTFSPIICSFVRSVLLGIKGENTIYHVINKPKIFLENMQQSLAMLGIERKREL